MQKNIISLIIGLTVMVTSHSSSAENLLDVYQQAQANDPVVLKAHAQFMASKESIIQARSVLLPQLYAFGKFELTEQEVNDIKSEDNETKTIGASLSMELYHHASWLKLGTAKKRAHQSDIAFQVAQQELIVRVTKAYFDVLSAKDDLEFAKAEKKAIARQLDQTKQRFKVGLTAITDVHEAQAQFDNTVTAEIRAENNVFNAEEALREITNIYPRNLDVLNTKRFSASRPTPESANDWQQTAEAKNLSLISQKISVDISKDSINTARAGHYPTIDLNGRYSKSDIDDQLMPSPTVDFNSQSIGIEINVPLYTGGAITSSVRQAQSNYVAASQDLAKTHRNVVRSTRNAYNTVIAAVSAIKSLEQSVISAESALRATEAGMDVGIRTIVDVLDSTRNLYNAKRNLSSTRYNYIQAILSLKQAAGTITEQDLVDINNGLLPST
ncbi:outer membrane channel protein TolC [Pseudocolwellia agarivorans]|uniref:outer membrane channel protein TolC n=1 Tax=Pseudocolwellia agarivorans TaxID=1911682 RepID=UPI000984E999|nr:outer membrane channel protein TolC [Pseudocolwellia agarivorans]